MEEHPQSSKMEPTFAQAARVVALNRFNRLYVYVPVGLVTALFLALSLYLLYVAIAPPTEETRPILSGLADLILIVWLLPLVLFFGISMVLVMGGYCYYWYGLDEVERPLPPAPPHGRLRTFLWRIDNALTYYMVALRNGERRLVAPLIQAHGRWASLAVWLDALFIGVKNFRLWR